MVRTRGPRLTPAQKTEVWRRWRQGESLSAIGRALGRIPRVVYHVVAGAGGMPPPPRRSAVTPRPDPGRAGGGVTGARAWARAARDRTRPGTRRVNGESRSAAARRPAPVSRHRRRPPGVEAKSAPQALSLGHLSRVARRRRDAARVRVVAAADRGLAADGVS